MHTDDPRTGAAPGSVADTAMPSRRWPLLMGLIVAAAIGASGFGYIWGLFAVFGLSSGIRGGSHESIRKQSQAELSAKDWSGVLSDGLDCAGAMAARLAINSVPSLLQDCQTRPRLLLQVWLLHTAGINQSGQQSPVRIDVHDDQTVLSSLEQRDFRLAADSQWDSYTLASGQALSINQFVPVRGLQKDGSVLAVLLMRYGAPNDIGVARLIDEHSADHGVAIPGAQGLRVAIDDTEAQRRIWATATWVLVVAGLAALLVGRQRLRDEVELRRDIEESSPVGLRVVDNEGRLIDVNSAFCATAGWNREDLLEKLPPYPYWPAQELEDRQSQLEAILNGTVDAEGYRVTFVRPAPAEPWLGHVRASRLHSGKGWILSSEDITEERAREEQVDNLKQELARKMDFAILGEKAKQLAHDLPSHLMAIDQSASNLELLVNSLGETVRVELTSIKKQIQLIGAQLEAFAMDVDGEMRYEKFKIDAAVADAMLLESERARALNAKVANLVNADMPAQLLPRVQLIQVLRNLISNGLSAMQQTPLLNRHLVVSSMVESEPPTPTHPNGRHWLHLTVEDKGCGIPDHKMRTLFDQPQGRSGGGRGLGLWLCRRWIERMPGRLTVRQTSQGSPTGTVMLIVLPYQQETASE